MSYSPGPGPDLTAEPQRRQQRQRKIIFIEMDAFHVWVEQRNDPFGFPLRLRTSTKLRCKRLKWITTVEVSSD